MRRLLISAMLPTTPRLAPSSGNQNQNPSPPGTADDCLEGRTKDQTQQTDPGLPPESLLNAFERLVLQTLESRASPLLRWMEFRLSSGNITPDSCAAHFDHLATAHGIVHPSRALRQLQKAGRVGQNVAIFASALRHGLILECEACIRWDGTKLQARQRTPSVVHSDVLHSMEAVLLAASAPPFSTYVNTRDNAFCHVAGQLADHVTGHGFSPPALLRAQTLLPLHLNQLEWIIAPNATKPNQQPQVWPAFDGCFWRGGNTGWHRVQSAFNANRTKCLLSQTDRQCVVNRHTPKANLMCRKRKCPATAADRQTIERSQCMLAVDGNSYATLFSRIMLAGRLAVRVGGWHAATQRRLSSFEWCVCP